MYRLLAVAGALIAAALPISGADAVSLTQTVQFGPGPTDYDDATGTTATGTSLSLFDTSVGVLNAISFATTYGFNSQITITNNSAQASSGNARVQSAAQFGASDTAIAGVLDARVNTFNDPIDGNSFSVGFRTLDPIAYDLRGNRSGFTLGPGTGTGFSSIASGSVGPVVDTNSADLAAFSRIGGGTFTPLFSTLTALMYSQSGGAVDAGQVTTAQGTLTLTYDYTAVPQAAALPEPATWATMLGGFGLLGLALRRRHAAARLA